MPRVAELGIMCTMAKEEELLLANLFNVIAHDNVFFSGTTKPNGGLSVLVCNSGIGKVNAALTAQNMISQGVSEIISIGCAAGADVSVCIGDIVIGDSFCFHDVWCGEPNNHGQVQGQPAIYSSNYKKWVGGQGIIL